MSASAIRERLVTQFKDIFLSHGCTSMREADPVAGLVRIDAFLNDLVRAAMDEQRTQNERLRQALEDIYALRRETMETRFYPGKQAYEEGIMKAVTLAQVALQGEP